MFNLFFNDIQTFQFPEVLTHSKQAWAGIR